MGAKTNMQKRRKNTRARGGSTAAFVVILIYALDIIKRILLTNIFGDEGNGFYAAAYEIFALIFLITGYALPQAVAKAAAARTNKEQYKNAKKVFGAAMLFAIITGILSSVLVFFFADSIASTIMLVPMSAMVLKLLSPALLLCSVAGVYRGYFEGVGTSMPTRVSNAIEKIIGFIISVAVAVVAMNYGSKAAALLRNNSYSASYAAAGAMAGISIGALIAIFFLMFLYHIYGSIWKRQMAKDATKTSESFLQAFRILFVYMGPVILSACAFRMIRIFDQIMFNHIMTENGMGSRKTILFGIYTGKYETIIYIFIYLACIMTIPLKELLQKAYERGDAKQVKLKTMLTLRFSAIVSIFGMVLCAILAEPIIKLIFDGKGDVSIAVGLLQRGAVLVLLYAVSITAIIALLGINKNRTAILGTFVAMTTHFVVLYAMLKFTTWSIDAVVYANIVFALILFFWNIIALKRSIHLKIDVMRTFIIPSVCAAIMGLITFLCYQLFMQKLTNGVALTICLFVSIITYTAFLLLLKGVRREELRLMPAGNIIIKFGEMLRLL